MGFRFRKSINLGGSVRLNINKKSIGLSAGTKGARFSVNSSGRKTVSAGIPGTGLSYVKTMNSKKTAGSAPYIPPTAYQDAPKKKSGCLRIGLYGLGILLSCSLILSGNPFSLLLAGILITIMVWPLFKTKKTTPTQWTDPVPPADPDPLEGLAKESLQKVVDDCRDIISRTMDLGVFLSRYDVMLERLGQLHDDWAVENAIKDYPAAITACVTRCLAGVSLLKTDRGKANRIKKHLDELDAHHPSNPELIRGDDYARSLFKCELEKLDI